MSLALNEVEATAKKATRGAGYSWGMAEEAARATRWLSANGIDGSGALATVLIAADGAEPGSLTPDVDSGEGVRLAGNICPLMAGTRLSDFALVQAAKDVALKDVIAPVMLLPFAAMAAHQLGEPVTVIWDGVSAVTDGSGLSLEGALFTETAERMTIRAGGEPGVMMPKSTRATPTDNDWATLNRFAARTYAPATEESRQKGAGAGLSDND